VNKTELASKVAESAGLSKVTAEKALKSVLDGIGKALTNDDSVTLVGFGSFSVAKRAARTCRNPQTGKEIKIAEKKVIKFNAGKALKESVNVKEKVKAGCGCDCRTAKKGKKK
jgi:DNA-binding protein HU-beta